MLSLIDRRMVRKGDRLVLVKSVGSFEDGRRSHEIVAVADGGDWPEYVGVYRVED